MRLLLEEKADPNNKCQDMWTALMIVARSRCKYSTEKLQLLLDHQAHVNTVDDLDRSPLLLAAFDGDENSSIKMRLLLNAGANPNMREESGLNTMILIILKGGQYAKAMLKVLLEAKPEIDAKNAIGYSALMLATMHSEGTYSEILDMIRLLVAHGATLPLVSELDPATPQSIIEYIHGAQNWTPIHRAADARDLDTIIKCLCNGGRADTIVDSPHADMRTALSIAKSTSYPTSQPVCNDCLALFQPSLVKGEVHSNDSLFGSGGGGGGGGGALPKHSEQQY